VGTTTALNESTLEWTNSDQHMMSRALTLAAEGIGRVSPGPLVGCVILSPGGDVVGEGFYVFEDVKHAETIALAQAGEKARGGTAYVSLEPHAHHGRTPPCTEALIAAGIKRVVAPIEDTNPKVAGRGFEHLRAQGIEVQTGLLANEAAKLNEAYLHYMRTGRPFVHLKMAVSLDGKIATRTGDSRWVAGPEAREQAHLLRHQYDAILIGAGTAQIDDPLLTDRSGKTRGRPLSRIVLDQRLKLSAESQLVRTAGEAPVLLFTGHDVCETTVQALKAREVDVVQTPTRQLEPMLDELGARLVQSLLVEGGAQVAGEFLGKGLVNKVTFFVAPKIVGSQDALSAVGGAGIDRMADALELENVEVIQRGHDIEITGYPRSAKK
jgi:diaminohydroxyphosphoribosylaminopyrimidine deaminase/5-amino-6-(5-phosphoribosylamino)uracil reductase